jgi:hypothetical protein
MVFNLILLLCQSFKFETNVPFFLKKTVISENGRMDQFIFLKIVDMVEEPNFLISLVELLKTFLLNISKMSLIK